MGVTPTGPFHPFVPTVIRSFREAFPRVSVTLDECLRTELLERLRGERMDVAFLRTPAVDLEGLAIHRLLVEPMVVVLPSGHALVRNRGDEAISMSELAGETFIMYARQHGPAIYDDTMAACLRAGFSPRLGQEAPRITSALALVGAGLGIAIVPASLQRMSMAGLTYRPLKGDARLRAVLNLACRRTDTSPVVRHFLSLARRAAKGFDGAQDL